MRVHPKFTVRLIGLLIAGLTLSQAWHSAHCIVFERIWLRGYTSWLWPFNNYDQSALDDLGQLLQFAFGLTLLLCAGFVSRLLGEDARAPGHCIACGYEIRGLVGGVCPECGAALPAAPATARNSVH